MHSVLAGNIEKALGYTSKAIELIHCNQGITTTIITNTQKRINSIQETAKI